jgi:hypothetical protein
LVGWSLGDDSADMAVEAERTPTVLISGTPPKANLQQQYCSPTRSTVRNNVTNDRFARRVQLVSATL